MIRSEPPTSFFWNCEKQLDSHFLAAFAGEEDKALVEYCAMAAGSFLEQKGY